MLHETTIVVAPIHVIHVYDFTKLACTNKTVTRYSSLSASRSLLLDFVHRDSGGDFLPCRMHALKLHLGYDRSTRAISHSSEIEAALRKDIYECIHLYDSSAQYSHSHSVLNNGRAIRFKRERQKLYERLTAATDIKNKGCAGVNVYESTRYRPSP